MPQLTPIKLDDETIIYIEATEDVVVPLATSEEPAEEEEEELIDKGMTKGITTEALRKQTIQSFQAIQGTIRAYTIYSLNALRKVAVANVDKVTLEFGIEIGGEAGVPYVTKGTAKSNLKITVECSFPENQENKS
ncbi:MAG: CU044_2847 family protein [Coleofasciculaceae cyanobacterium]